VGELLQLHEKATAVQLVGKGADSGGLKLERMRMPSFDGNIRDYPRFKADFLKQVVPQTKGDDSTAYALKSCLRGTPIDITKNVDDDLNEMWKRLDEKYGTTSKLTETIMFDVKRIKPLKDEEEQNFEFVDIIEQGYRDLARMKVEHELANTTVIGLLEEKLPKNIRREWSKRVNAKDTDIRDDNRFSSFLSFLLEQRLL